MEIKTLSSDLHSFNESILSRLPSLLPQGESQIHAITVYMIQCHTDVKAPVSSEEIEIEEIEEIEDQKAEAIVTLQDIRQTLENLQTDLKKQNAEAVQEKVRLLISSYGYTAPGLLHLVEG
jgi:hypothetical protein